MIRDAEVYSVQYNYSTKKWTVYINGTVMVKSENPGSGPRYTYHDYDRKQDAVDVARKAAKNDANRSQLKVYNKTGSKTTEISNYEGRSGL